MLNIQIKELVDKREAFLSALLVFIELASKVRQTTDEYQRFQAAQNNTEADRAKMVRFDCCPSQVSSLSYHPVVGAK